MWITHLVWFYWIWRAEKSTCLECLLWTKGAHIWTWKTRETLWWRAGNCGEYLRNKPLDKFWCANHSNKFITIFQNFIYDTVLNKIMRKTLSAIYCNFNANRYANIWGSRKVWQSSDAVIRELEDKLTHVLCMHNDVHALLHRSRESSSIWAPYCNKNTLRDKKLTD